MTNYMRCHFGQVTGRHFVHWETLGDILVYWETFWFTGKHFVRWETLGDISVYWETLPCTGGHFCVLGDTGRHFCVLGDILVHWETLGDILAYWETFRVLGNILVYWEIPGDISVYWDMLLHTNVSNCQQIEIMLSTLESCTIFTTTRLQLATDSQPLQSLFSQTQDQICFFFFLFLSSFVVVCFDRSRKYFKVSLYTTMSQYTAMS